MHTIRVDDETYTYLMNNRSVDLKTPNDVIKSLIQSKLKIKKKIET